MPKLNGKKYSYSAKGISAYKKALKKLKKRKMKEYGDSMNTETPNGLGGQMANYPDVDLLVGDDLIDIVKLNNK